MQTTIRLQKKSKNISCKVCRILFLAGMLIFCFKNVSMSAEDAEKERGYVNALLDYGTSGNWDTKVLGSKKPEGPAWKYVAKTLYFESGESDTVLLAAAQFHALVLKQKLYEEPHEDGGSIESSVGYFFMYLDDLYSTRREDKETEQKIQRILSIAVEKAIVEDPSLIGLNERYIRMDRLPKGFPWRKDEIKATFKIVGLPRIVEIIGSAETDRAVKRSLLLATLLHLGDVRLEDNLLDGDLSSLVSIKKFLYALRTESKDLEFRNRLYWHLLAASLVHERIAFEPILYAGESESWCAMLESFQKHRFNMEGEAQAKKKVLDDFLERIKLHSEFLGSHGVSAIQALHDDSENRSLLEKRFIASGLEKLKQISGKGASFVDLYQRLNMEAYESAYRWPSIIELDRKINKVEVIQNRGG